MTKQSVLILGSGLVAKPGAQYLAEQGFSVIVASRRFESAEELCNHAKRDSKVEILDITPTKCDVETDFTELSDLVSRVDHVVSLLPYLFHTQVAKEALKHKKHFYTTSYVSEAMRELAPAFLDAGLVMINECGVDPGTDHMSAMKIIDKVHDDGGKIESFTSYCGGLPAPSCNDNPFGYKLSWAPRGVLLASRNDALFLENGKDVTIPGKVLFDNYRIFNIEGMGEFEGYPNRNSKQYIDIYKIPEVQTIVRGTFRNRGWCATIKKLTDLGFLSIDSEDDLSGQTYAQVMGKILGTKYNLKSACAQVLSLKEDNPIMHRIEWIGCFSEETIPEKTSTKLDALCHLFKSKLVYKQGEQDLLLMQHYFIADFKDRKEHITSTLIDYGIKNGDTSMSRTVSLPVAIAVKLVATGKFTKVGLQVPMIPELYNPILDELDSLGIKFVEKVVKVEAK